MPRGRPRSLAHIFEQFIASLANLIKTEVGRAVNKATTEYLASKFGGVAKPEAPTRRKRRYRRHKTVAAKPVRLSKHGKRIGRPPKAKA